MAHPLTPIPPLRGADYRADWPYEESAICPWAVAPQGPPPVKRPCYASIRRGPTVSTRLPEPCASGSPSELWERGHPASKSRPQNSWSRPQSKSRPQNSVFAHGDKTVVREI
ncbi:uncharacterized protein LOC144138034 [Haemaphysalis longicornis]